MDAQLTQLFSAVKVRTDLLTEENTKLKAHYEETMSKEHGWGNALMAEMYEKKDIRNEELEEKNSKLTWDCEQLKKSPWVGTPVCDKMLDLKQQIDKLKQENAKLKEDTGDTVGTYDGFVMIVKELREQIAKLTEENAKLKEDELYAKKELAEFIIISDKMVDENFGLTADLSKAECRVTELEEEREDLYDYEGAKDQFDLVDQDELDEMEGKFDEVSGKYDELVVKMRGMIRWVTEVVVD